MAEYVRVGLMESPLITYRLRSGSHPALIERMRQIYDDNLDDLDAGKNIPAISPEEQYRWWHKVADHPNTQWYLFSPKNAPWEIVGFLQMTRRPGNEELHPCYTQMFAVDPQYHKRGYGVWIDVFALREYKGYSLRASQWIDNKGIARIHKAHGWETVAEAEKTEYLFHPNGSGLTNVQVVGAPT